MGSNQRLPDLDSPLPPLPLLSTSWKKKNLRFQEEELECSICLCEGPGFQTACGHSYHINCII